MGITRLATTSVLAGAFLVTPAAALNIILNYDPTQPDSAPPASDPTGANLTALMQYAETYYQDIFEDSHTLTINYWWANLSGGNIGLHTPVSFANGRQSVSNIRLDPSPNWFFDPTPEDDDEFNMNQTLWRDLTSTQRLNDFNNFGGGVNQVPDTFEVGFTGNAIAGGAAANRRDALSTVMHEIGHALGMSSGNPATIAETADGDYDFDPDFILGQSLAAETADTNPGDNANIAHLARPTALMDPGRGPGQRFRPSHTDLFSMASGHSYVNLDVPRREFYGDSVGDGIGSWNTDAHWSGNQRPSTADDVFVRAAQPGVTMTAFLTANGFARSLNVSEAANVDTGAFKLDIGGDVTITGVDSDVIIDPDGELEADEVFVQNSAEITMSGGELDARRVTLDPGAQLRGFNGGSATIQISEDFRNNGTIRSTADGLLFFQTTTPTPWNLDGFGSSDGDGEINASTGRIWFDTGAMTDNFSGTVVVGAGQFFRFDAPWTADGNSRIDLNGGTTDAERARIIGGTLTAVSFADIEASGQVDFDSAVDFGTSVLVETTQANANVEFNATADIDGTNFTIRTGSSIDFNANTNLSGTSTITTINNLNGTATPAIDFNGPTSFSSYRTSKTGTPDLILRQNGDATFIGTNTIEASVYDLDGAAGNTTINIGGNINNGSLTLDVDLIDTPGANIFNGTLDIRGSFGGDSGLTVNLSNPNASWGMAGTADLAGNVIAYLNVISGSQVNLTGTVNVSSLVGINADADFASGVDVNFASASSGIALRGDATIAAGATFNGGGRLDVQTTGSLTFFDNASLGTSDLINRGVLEIDGTTDGTLDDFTQTNSGDWNVDLGGSSSTLYDVLVAQGDVQLDGDIALDVVNGYAPTLYNTTHTVLNGIFSATLDGIFDRVLGAVQSGYGLAVLYTAQDVRVRAALLGDANLNQQVEQGDLDAVLSNWGQSNFAGGAVTWLEGDLNGNGQVEQGDLDLVLANWGDLNAPDFRGFSVPEPAGCLILAGCFGAVSGRRR